MSTRNPFSGADDGPAPPEHDGDSSDVGGSVPSSSGGAGRRIKAAVDPDGDLLCARLPLTDLGNAERWLVRFGADFRFCPELGWFWWDTRRWKLLSEEKDAVPAELMQSMAVTVRAIRNEAALVAASGYPAPMLSDKDMRELESWAQAHGTTSYEFYLAGLRPARPDWTEEACRDWIEALEPMDVVLGKQLWSHKIAAWAKSSEAGGMPGRMLKWIKGFLEVVVRPDAFDRDPLAINVMNGTLRLARRPERRSSADVAAGKSAWRTGAWSIKKSDHRREDLITKLAPVKYSPAAKCDAYDKFIHSVQPDEAMRRFLHQWGGYSLTGDTTEHKMAFFYGQGRNGKGTWVEAMAFMAGDYAGAIGIESLLDSGGQRRGDQATPDLAELPGVRLLRVSEPQKGMKFNDGLIKQLTGGDPVKARHLNKGFFEFFPDFKITVSGNTRPIVKDVSHGMWARMQLVPWDTIIAEEDIDRSLPDTLKGEASGILNRMIAGLLDWREHGLIIPEQVRMATQAYRESSDELGRFLSELCEVSKDTDRVRVSAGDLHKLYKAWSEVAGGSGWHIKGFKGAMEDKGFKSTVSNGVKWLGVQPRAGVNIEDVARGEWPGKPREMEPDNLPSDYDDDGPSFDD
ncbi:phage/plasmid primase, P4 family [uncultured Novosphingobium sp.]|uniref:DNA primase family protein n=1 Tax=uncultured Novosphingobium sp. TaxID=292277 RepID=UPI00258B48A2|nr:phage/plasmid primase, P4 family [uncultured Novosphingobium sp.]